MPKRKDNYTQVVVWPGTVVGQDEKKNFVSFMKKNFNVRVKYLEEITVDWPHNPETGTRNDLFFSVHDEDLTPKFCVERLQYGMRWIEDVLNNEEKGQSLYPDRVKNYCSWDASN